MHRSIIMTSLLTGLAMLATPIEANAKARLLHRTMSDGQTVDAPRGYVTMCETQPELCVSSTAGSALPPIGQADVRRMLKRVNRLVNGRVRQITDMEAFGSTELWRRSGIGRWAYGDCEDLALEKRERLIAAGLPRDMLFFATAWRADLGLHVVLVARTDAGDLVLDSRSPYIQPWSRVPYQWISRQHADEPSRWSVILDAPEQQMAERDPLPIDIAASASGALADAAESIERGAKSVMLTL